uniref:Uncharacterized protein n=1 Tax=Strigamia maritima TaxID=126957 RepID=T1JD33_STRMM
MRKASIENGRPSLVPVRNRNRTGSFGVADGKRKSNIPLFKKGANFGTTAPPRPSLLGMNKSCGKLSGSNFLGLGRVSTTTAENKRESRPLFDKNFQQKCIGQLFEFLYRFVDQKYVYPEGGKAEEEIPRLLQEIQYPIVIHKSQVTSVSSSHSWPALLAALDWLKNVVSQIIIITKDPIVNELEELRSQFCYKTYATFLRGSDDHETEHNELRVQFHGNSCANVKEIEAEHLALEKEILALQSQEDPLPGLESKLALMASDVEKFDAYLDKSKSHMDSKKQQTVSLNVLIVENEEKLKLLKEDTEQKKKLVKMQEIDLPMYEEMQKKNVEQIKYKLKLEEELKDIIEANGCGEIEISKTIGNMESMCKKFNDLCCKVRLIPITEQFAQNQDFELRFNFGNDMTSRVDQIKVMINDKVKQIRKMNLDLTKQLIDNKNYVVRLSDLNAEGEQEIDKMTVEMKDLDKEIEECKRVNATHFQQSEAEIKKLMEKLRDLTSTNCQFKFSEIQKENEEIRLKLEKVNPEVAEHITNADKFYDRALNMHEDFNLFMIKEKSVTCEKIGNTFLIGINRPEKRNCVNRETAGLLVDAILAFEKDSEALVAVLHGIGGNFCSGLDLDEVSKMKNDTNMPPAPMGPSRMFVSKPMIAAIDGYAVAGGMELALLCDLRVMEETAIMGIFCRRFGVPLIDGGTIRLPNLIGLSRALDLILTGRHVTAQEAFEIGLANRLVPCGTGNEFRSLGQAVSLARNIAKFPQECMNVDRASAYYSVTDATSMTDAFKYEHDNGRRVISSEAVIGAGKFVSGVGRHGKFNINPIDRDN